MFKSFKKDSDNNFVASMLKKASSLGLVAMFLFSLILLTYPAYSSFFCKKKKILSLIPKF